MELARTGCVSLFEVDTTAKRGNAWESQQSMKHRRREAVLVILYKQLRFRQPGLQSRVLIV